MNHRPERWADLKGDGREGLRRCLEEEMELRVRSLPEDSLEGDRSRLTADDAQSASATAPRSEERLQEDPHQGVEKRSIGCQTET
jgi:hypothetical protein